MYTYYYCPRCGRTTSEMPRSSEKYKPTEYQITTKPYFPKEIITEILLYPCGLRHTWFSLSEGVGKGPKHAR